MRWAAVFVLMVCAGWLGLAAGVRSGEPAHANGGPAAPLPAPSAPDGPPAAPDVEIRFPPHKAVVHYGTFDVIAQGNAAGLVVDGQAQAWDAFQSPLRVARVRLSSGHHAVQVGDKRCELFFARYPGDEDAPRGWPVFRWHPIRQKDGAQQCADCHETAQAAGQTAVGRFKGHEACFACHAEADFEKSHAHPVELLKTCQQCHALHGVVGEEKGLVKPAIRNLAPLSRAGGK